MLLKCSDLRAKCLHCLVLYHVQTQGQGAPRAGGGCGVRGVAVDATHSPREVHAAAQTDIPARISAASAIVEILIYSI